MSGIAVGTVVTFGRWIHCDNTWTRTPIDWIVMETDGQVATLISLHGLETKAYDDDRRDVTRETCTLRAWLNGHFLNAAFTDEEQTRLEVMTVAAGVNPECDTDPGPDTLDRVTLPGIDEAERWFASDDERICLATDRALTYNRHVWNAADGRSNECAWWLRSLGDCPRRAGVVSDWGDIISDGWDVNSDEVLVRPVIALRHEWLS